MSKYLWGRHTTRPSKEEMHDNMCRFFEYNNMHMCFGVVDGSHIPITAPRKQVSDYYNRKGFFPIMLQFSRQVIECTFGRLKGRFRILKFPFQWWDVKSASKMVVACWLHAAQYTTFVKGIMTTTASVGSTTRQSIRIGTTLMSRQFRMIHLSQACITRLIGQSRFRTPF